MRFLADENCDALIVKRLREKQHDVLSIAEINSGEIDVNILKQSLDEKRVLITEDLDFSELVLRDVQPAYGILSIRIPSDQRIAKIQRIIEIAEQYENQLIGSFTTVSLDDVRIRTLPYG